jgi:hypothetical protein
VLLVYLRDSVLGVPWEIPLLLADAMEKQMGLLTVSVFQDHIIREARESE